MEPPAAGSCFFYGRVVVHTRERLLPVGPGVWDTECKFSASVHVARFAKKLDSLDCCGPECPAIPWGVPRRRFFHHLADRQTQPVHRTARAENTVFVGFRRRRFFGRDHMARHMIRRHFVKAGRAEDDVVGQGHADRTGQNQTPATTGRVAKAKRLFLNGKNDLDVVGQTPLPASAPQDWTSASCADRR